MARTTTSTEGHKMTTSPAARRPRTAHERCTRIVEMIAAATGDEWTLGYIGNVDRHGDDRPWFAFRAHPGRVGTAADRIGGLDLEDLAPVLSGALQMARMQAGA